MLVHKQSWIISLLLLFQCGVEAEKTEVCEGESAALNCGERYIKIVQANYGRTDRTTCAAGKKENSISNTRCLQASSLNKMSEWCDGRKSCKVPATSSVFTDPCTETYKYLSVSYECIPARKIVICQDNQDVIKCASCPQYFDWISPATVHDATNYCFEICCFCVSKGTGVISVHYANYGRRDLVSCPGKLATTRYCYSPQTSSLRSRCDGKKSCDLSASDSIYPNACFGVHKYLEVTYSCE